MKGRIILMAAALLGAAVAARASSEQEQLEALREFNRLTRPAVPPGRSGGEYLLIRKLEQGSPAEQLAAASALRSYVQGSYDARTAMIAALQKPSAPAELRRELARSLSWGGHDQRVADAMLAFTQGERDEELRAFAYKTLYRMTNRSEIERAVRDALDWREPARVRGGAAWAAFKAAGRADMRRALLDLVEDYNGDTALRVEALKSLFSQMGLAQVRDAAYKLAESGSTPEELRYAAVLALVRRAGESGVRRLLEKLVDDGGSLGEAAMRALTGSVDEEIAAFFHLDALPNGIGRDPLLGEG